MTFDTLEALAGSVHGHGHGGGPPAVLQKGKVSGFLVELAPGATPLQARFAILSTLKGVKVVTGDSTMSGIRQGLAALLQAKSPEVNAAHFLAPRAGCEPDEVRMQFAMLEFELMIDLYRRQRDGELTTLMVDKTIWRRLAA